MRWRATLAVLAVLALCAGAERAWAAPRVVVTIKPIHALVAAVMAGVGAPELLVKGTTSPHVYALKPSDVSAISGADILFRTAAATEPFSTTIGRMLPPGAEFVTLLEAPGVVAFERRTGPDFETPSGSRGGHGHSHAQALLDGHIWLDPNNAKAMVARIAEVLAARDPADAPRFNANAAQLNARLDALATELETALAPLADKPYVVAHDAYQYFERRFRLKVVGAIALSPELPPSGKRLAELRRKIVALGAICVFAEPELDRRLIDNLTEGTPARTGTLDPEGFRLEPGPNLYFTLLRKLAGDLLGCLLPPA